MQGRRVYALDDVREIGDYFVRVVEGEIDGMWLLAPDGKTFGRIAATGHAQALRDGVLEPEWEIVINADETVTVSPSIDAGPGAYHGFLRDGVWT